jgi:TetR/AcrR family transcriptional regulator
MRNKQGSLHRRLQSVSEAVAEADPTPAKRKRRNGPTSRDIQRENTRARIIQCALQVFSAKGFQGGSTHEIAAAAGVRQALLSHYFESKYAIWQAAITSLFADVTWRYEEHRVYDMSRPVEDRIKSLIRAYTGYIFDHPEHARLIEHAAMQGGEPLEWINATHMRHRFNASLALMKEAMEAGVFPNAHPVMLHFSFVGAVHTLYLLEAEARSLAGFDPRAPGVLDRHCEVLFEIFLRKPPHAN